METKVTRGNFLKGVAAVATTAIIPNIVLAKSSKKSSSVRFGVISDIHPDIMFDSNERLQSFLNQADSEGVDFIIELGDFCQAKEANRSFLNVWNSYKGQSYHTIGNHDLDHTDKAEYMTFVGLKSRYYSFDVKDFHFIVLDLNNILEDGKFKSPFRSGRYGDHIDQEQLDWLKSDIESTDKKCVIFSHQSLERDGVIKNSSKVREIFERENQRVGYPKIVAVLCGHDHTDYQKIIRGIAYIQINSACNQWVGSECLSRYSAEINEKHPYIRYTAPYKESLYAFISMDDKRLTQKGKKSSFVSPQPEELDIARDIDGVLPLVAYISDFTFIYPKNIY